MPIKCLIPAAGKGTRMRPLTHSLPKAMLPVAGKPMLFHIIDRVHKESITDFVIITGYLKDLMESEILSEYPNLNIDFIEQKEQKGLGHACFMAKEKINRDDRLLIIYGDTLFETNLDEILKSDIPIIGGAEVEDPQRFGIIELKENSDYIKDLIEKPSTPPTNLAIPGVNYFPSAGELFDSMEYIIQNNIKTKDEYQITDAFKYMLHQKNVEMKYFNITEWYDCGTLDTILETNQEILMSHGSTLQGVCKDTQITEPVYISPQAEIANSRIGPNVSIGINCNIHNSFIHNAIIDQNSHIVDSHLKDSIIGRNVNLASFKGKVILGDHSDAEYRLNDNK